MRTASNSGCGFSKLNSTWFTAGRYLRGLEVKFSYLHSWGQVARNTIERVTYLHTLKLSTESALHPKGTDVVGSLADTNISYLAFVNQFFEFPPSRVGILGQRLVNDDLLLFFVRFLLERDRPVTQASTPEMATGECNTYQ